MVYSNDARNLHFEFKINCFDGRQEEEVKMRMGKQQMTTFFEQIEKIQD
jgi:hypothetical protein